MKNSVIEKIKTNFPNNVTENGVKLKVSELVNNRNISRNDLIEIFNNYDYDIFIELTGKKSGVVSELISFLKKHGIDADKLPDFMIATDDEDPKELYIRVIIDHSDKTTMIKLANIVDQFVASDGSYIGMIDIKQIDINDKKLLRELADEKNVIW